MSNIFNSAVARQNITGELARTLATQGALVADLRRVRSSFFDGRLLVANDLIRDHAHFSTRHADLGRAASGGVIWGFDISIEPNPTLGECLRISRGHGLTPSGEIVVLGDDVQVGLDVVHDIERLDAAFGIGRLASAPARNRTGLYIVALRPVEYTANPVASYPTSLDAGRTVHDADVIEAVAITLIPFPEHAPSGTLDARRSGAAYAIFVGGMLNRVREDALPIAMLALDHGLVRWLDPFLVRREVVFNADGFGFNRFSRAIRAAHVLQYNRQLSDILAARTARGQMEVLVASDHFKALPPVGRLPNAGVDIGQHAGRQSFFPPEIEISIASVPPDEMAAIIEESALLPPIDLTQGGSVLEGMSVLLLGVPPRNALPVDTNGCARVGELAMGWALTADTNYAPSVMWYVRRKNRFSAVAVGVAASLKSETTQTNQNQGSTPRTKDEAMKSILRTLVNLKLDMLWGKTLEMVRTTGAVDLCFRLSDLLLDLDDFDPILWRCGFIGELMATATITGWTNNSITTRFSAIRNLTALSRIEKAIEATCWEFSRRVREAFALSLVVPEMVHAVEQDVPHALPIILSIVNGIGTSSDMAASLRKAFK